MPGTREGDQWDAFIRQHGRPPTAAEWRGQHQPR